MASTNNPFLDEVQAIAEEEGASLVSVCAAIEAEIAELDDSEKQAFLDELKSGRTRFKSCNSCGLQIIRFRNLFYCRR